MRMSAGRRPSRCRWYKAGSNLCNARSPVPPKTSMSQGSVTGNAPELASRWRRHVVSLQNHYSPTADHTRVLPVNLLQHIAQSRHLLRKSELKVADHVLLDPAAVMHSSMADLAQGVGVSEPTIVRFCRAIGCSGFQDLKLRLAQSLAAGASFGQFAISENDSVADFSLKIFDTTLHTLMEVREKLDPDAL